MTPASYRQALTTLSLTNDQAAIWLGVGRSTAFRYANEGAPGPVERALLMAVGVMGAEVVAVSYDKWPTYDPLVRHSDLSAVVGLPEPSRPSPVHNPTHTRAGE